MDSVPRTFIAIGDSFTEGLDDLSPRGDGSYRGWADRVAERFAELDSEFRYANLAVRGRKLGSIIEQQVPQALELRPELVSLAGGTNDVLRPRVDFDSIVELFDSAVRRLRENGSQVLLFQSVDPTPRSRLIGRTLARIKTLTTLVEEVGERYDCVVVKLWRQQVFSDPRVWSADRLHLSSLGHELVADAVLERLGLGDHAWSADLGPYDAPPLRERIREDAVWARRHLAPWIGRRLRGVSSGDLTAAKRPDLAPVD
jgi:lysophospholipase L1-like esterase